MTENYKIDLFIITLAAVTVALLGVLFYFFGPHESDLNAPFYGIN